MEDGEPVLLVVLYSGMMRSTPLRRTMPEDLAQRFGALPTGPSVVAAFDVDGTLTEGGSVYAWLAAVGGRRRTIVATLSNLVPVAIAAITGGTRADAVKQAVFQRVIRGIATSDLDETSRRFAAHHYRRELRPAAKAQVEWHRAHGHRIVLVSASPEIYVAKIAMLLGADSALATKLAVATDGTMTGSYEGKNCRGDEKIARLRAFIGSEPATLVAYGNSRGDAKMLAAADVGVDCGKLGPLSALKAYPALAQVRSLLSSPSR